MIDGKRVVAWTPYGRHKTVEILLEYLQRDHDRGIVDEYWLCLNMDPQGQQEDAAWALRTTLRRDWVKAKERPRDVIAHSRKQRNTGYFYRYMIDPDTIYVRFDDDVIYVHDYTIDILATYADAGPQACAFPMIINNAICSHFLQRDGKLEGFPEVGLYCMDPNGWGNGQFAVNLHEWFLTHIDNGTVESLFGHHNYRLPMGEQFSVSCFASRGEMYAGLRKPGKLMPDHIIEEESWHTEIQPRKLGIPNVIVSNAFVSHYTFYTQHPFFEGSDILDRYRTLAKGLTT